MYATKESIGRVIQQLRQSQNPRMSQSALAAKANYGKGGHVTISHIEAGKSSPRKEQRDPLAKALGTTWEEIEKQAAKLDLETERKATLQSSTTSSFKRMLYGDLYVDTELGKSELESRITRLRERQEQHSKLLNEAIEDTTSDFVEPAFEILVKIDGLESTLPNRATSTTSGDSLDAALQLNSDLISSNVINMLKATAGMGAVGLGAGATAAATTYAAVGAFATASTGTAIAGLSGVAATNATLAWLGGGALAAGGGGMAVGTAVLSGIFALPILLGVVATMVWQGSKARDAAKESAKQLAEAQAQVDEVEVNLRQAWEWAENARTVLRASRREGRLIVKSIQEIALVRNSSVSEDQRIYFAKLSSSEQQLVKDCLDLIAIVARVAALPIWANLQMPAATKEIAGNGIGNETVTNWVDRALVTVAATANGIANRRRSNR